MSVEKRHLGLRIGLERCIHSILLDHGKKYDRYLAIAYLPERENMPSCLAIGNLEVSKEEEGKEFFNPCKFYSSETLFEVIVHMLCTCIAFEAIKRGVPPYQVFIKYIRTLQNDRNLHVKMRELVEKYYSAMSKS